MIVVNFKTYAQATGTKAIELALICDKVAKDSGLKIIIAVQTTDIERIVRRVRIPVFGQHLDAKGPGKYTGAITALALRNAGASGVLLNHSEHFFYSFSELGRAIELAKNQGLQVLAFAKDLKIAQKIDTFKPEFLAYEEPTMVAGDQAMIQLPQFHQKIRRFVQAVESIPLIGAGIKEREDVFNSLKLGIKGIAFSSGFVKSENPRQVLMDFCSAFKIRQKQNHLNQ